MDEPSRPVAVTPAALAAALADFSPDPGGPGDPAAQRAAHLARRLQERASLLQTPQERRQQAELDRMIRSPHDRATLTQLTDQAFRSEDAARAADQLVHVLDVQGIPRFFSPVEQALLRGFQSFGSYLPGVAVPLVKGKMHHETANVVLPADREMLEQHLAARRAEGVRMNVNFLGEALLGEGEAERRLDGYLEALRRPGIEVISVKVSTLYSQITPLARRRAIEVLCERMERLYRAADAGSYERGDGRVVPKFVYMDMEEYRDTSITAEVFMRTLERPGLERASAGLALQAYLPDAFRTQRQITEWAARRVAAGGGDVTLRIVKGANMEAERLEASLRGWPQAPYKTKRETDANYKRMLRYATTPESLCAARLGIASHNLFDLAYGLVLAEAAGALERVQFEMLEGMANHQRRALFELTRSLLLYAPACSRDAFVNAIGYLVRRLDENTGPENFLRHAFKLDVDGEDWRDLERGFFAAFDAIEGLSDAPRRGQDRRRPAARQYADDAPEPGGAGHAGEPLRAGERACVGEAAEALSIPASGVSDWRGFANEPDSDFALPHNVEWAEALLERWKTRCDARAEAVPVVVAGHAEEAGRETLERQDPSRPGVVVARCQLATLADVDRAVACAQADEAGWGTRAPAERAAALRRVAHEVRRARAELMGAAAADGGKTLAESDPEVSEAVDFLEFYARSAEAWCEHTGLRATPAGVVAVVPPWNFPIAIPCGGVAAALAAGNCVILKPSPETILTAHLLCECFWRAGISRLTLQLLPCRNRPEAQHLATHSGVAAVVFTGGTETAFQLLAAKPTLRLLAETGGKNATIVSALSDRQQAIKHVLASAFGHSGQKCSATSLLVLEEEVYEDTSFRSTLCDAVESLAVGSTWTLESRLGPLIRPPAPKLLRALEQLEPGESWAVEPRCLEDNPQLYSPAVKWGVAPGSFTHATELFGPVLGVMKARGLREAIELVNQTGYGLTSGLESLDDREQSIWRDAIRAGNLYINRPTTGAIVLRQPFGGFGRSAVGPGIKAGGPSYVAQLMGFEETEAPATSGEVADTALGELTRQLSLQEDGSPVSGSGICERDLARSRAAVRSYDEQVRREFAATHDHFRLIGQDNLRRYLPVSALRIRVHPDDSFFELLARIAAARAVGCRTTVSSPPAFPSASLDLLEHLTRTWAAAIEFVEESDAELAEGIASGQTDRVRYAHASRVPEAVRRAAAEAGLYIADAAVCAHGRLELLWYVREQSLSIDYHRYGNLGERSDEPRADTL